MSTSEIMENTLFNRTFRDGDGNIVIAQKPNLPILVWLANKGSPTSLSPEVRSQKEKQHSALSTLSL